ncbi:hypothetical protein ACAG26_05400 [Mycobacterium sp. pUA109]|uniref:hypothetical protein n=1 Tax=Mycobacterium sp. pUA109 TaxID=3238982 RepID=UPI00351ABAD2
MKHVALLVFVSLFFGGFAIVCLVWLVTAVTRDEYPTAVVALGFGVFCVGGVASTSKSLIGVTPRVAFDDAGTTIRPDRISAVILNVSLVAVTIAMGLGAILSLAGELDIPVDPDERINGEALILGLGAVAFIPTLWRQFSRGTYLRLTPSGFEIAQGRAVEGGWDDVDDITDKVPGRRVQQPSAIVMAMLDGRYPNLTAHSFTRNGQALRAMVRFYWQHPEHRSELTDGRAAGRLSGERFAV